MGEDGAVIIRADLDDKKAQAELNRLARKIDNINDQIEGKTRKRSYLEERAAKIQEAYKDAISTDGADEYAQRLAKEYTQVQTAIARINDQLRDHNIKLDIAKEKAGEYAAQLGGVEKTEENVEQAEGEVTQAFEETTAAARETGEAGEEAGERISAAMKRASDRIGRIGKKLIGMVRRVFLFSVITRALRGVREYFSNILNSTPEFTAAMGQLKSAFLTLAQPIVSVVIPALTGLLQIITKIVTVIASFVAQLFGTTFEASQEAAKALNEQAEAYKDTGNAAKKASKQLAAFDQLNILSETNGGGGGIDEGAAKFDLPSIGEIKGLEKFTEWFKNLNFEPILEAWERLKESFSNLKETIGEGFSWFWDNVLAPLAKWTIEEAAPRLVDLLAKALDFLNAVLEKLGPILEPFWNNVLKPFIEWLGKLVLTGLDELIDLLDKLTKLINGEISWQEFIDGLDGVQIALLALGGLAVLLAIGKVIKAIASIPVAIVKNIPKATTALGKMAKAIGIGALGVFDMVMIAYDVVKLKEAADTFHEAQLAHNNETETALSSYAKLYQEKGKEAADEWAKMVYQIDTTNMSFEEAQKAITEKVDSYWEDTPQNMWDGFKKGWKQWFGEDGKNLWDLVKTAFQNVIDWLKDLLGIHSPSTVFDGIGQDICQGLWDGFKSVWGNFSSWLGDAWDGIKKWWNGLTLKAPENQESTYTISDSHSGSGRSVKVPGLAAGSVIPPNREFLAVLGDQKSGTNIEAPLDTIVAAFKQAMGEYGGGSFNFYLDGDPIYANVERRRSQAMRAGGR